MQIFALDTDWPGIERLDFDQPDAPARLDTAGILLWQPAITLTRYAAHTERIDDAGRPVLTPAASQQLLADARRWRTAFESLIRHDGLLVVLLDDIAPLGVHTLQEVVAFDVQVILPGEPVLLTALAQDSAPTWQCGAPFRRPLEQLGRHSRAATGIDCAQRTVLATGPDSATAVALYRYQQPGHLLMMPRPQFAAIPSIKTGAAGNADAAAEPDPRSLLIELAGALTGRPEIAVTPADPAQWYDEERQALFAIAAHRTQQRQLDRDIRAQQRLLQRYALARSVASGQPADAARAWELLLPGFGAQSDGEETAPAQAVGFTAGGQACLVKFVDTKYVDATNAARSLADLADQLRAMAIERYGPVDAAGVRLWLAGAAGDMQLLEGGTGGTVVRIARDRLAALVFDADPRRALAALIDPANIRRETGHPAR